MVEIAVFGLVIMAAINVAVILVPYFNGTGELLTIRNFFLVGFTIYQITSAIISLTVPFSFDLQLVLIYKEQTAITYFSWVVIFEIVFLAFYRWGFGAKRLAKWTPVVKGETREPILWLFAFILLGVALLLRFSVFIPYVAIVANEVGTAIAAVATGLGAWIWIRRPFNPVTAAVMFAVLIAAIGISSLGIFGRRPIVAVTGCLLWGAYYARWRGLPPSQVIWKAAILGIIPIVLIAKFSATRGESNRENTSVVTVLTKVATGDTRRGLQDLLMGQECAAWSMHLMEVYPEAYDYRWFHAFKYFFQFPIPRAIYPDKPDALAEIAWVDAGVTDKGAGFTIGPGILGHAASEGGLIAVVFYAAVLGLFIRYFDSVAARAPNQPFVVLPIGSSLGNLLGLPRGEVPNFAFEFMMGVVGSLVMLIIVAKVLKMMGLISDQDFATDPDLLTDITDEEASQERPVYTGAYAGYADYGQTPRS